MPTSSRGVRLGVVRTRFGIAAAVGIGILALFGLLAFRWADEHARSETDEAAAQQARMSANLLASELQKFRLLPLVLAEYPDARAVLAGGTSSAPMEINRKLELLANRTDAAAIYLIRPDGTTIAASNWNLPSSFVGQNYAFRPYFRGAMARGAAELYALGTVSGRPGLFIAQRIDRQGKPLGVVVVKVEFDRLEREWRRQGAPTFVSDNHGVIIITSKPEWRFRTIAPIDQSARAAIRRAVQFGEMPLDPLGLERTDGALVDGGVEYREAVTPVPMPAAELHLLQSLEPELASANAYARTAVLLVFMALGGMFAAAFRASEKKRLEAEARQNLEREVIARTEELDLTNRKYRNAREELAQASRLGSIGQITAGVAHEVNQPVAAIRGFADNAAAFLDRGDTAKVRGNLTAIVGLTERIGAITTELRSFARRTTPAPGPVDIASAVDGALILIGDRMREQGVRLDRVGPEEGHQVRADQVRLEQIIINLLQNALDAVKGVPDPLITIGTAVNGKQVALTVTDNGVGIDPAVADEIFTPFVTNKAEGLGLGLGIARDIAREFGGTLEVKQKAGPGATFLLKLKRA